MSVVENATISMTYAKLLREQAAHLARQRATPVNWAQFLAAEDDVIKRNVLCELGQCSSTMKAHPWTNKWAPHTQSALQSVGKGGKKGNGKKGKGKGKVNKNEKQVTNDWAKQLEPPRMGQQLPE